MKHCLVALLALLAVFSIPYTGCAEVKLLGSGQRLTTVPGTCGHKLYCWGDNSAGQIGDGTKTMRTVPTQVTLPPDVNGFISYSGMCALGDNGKIYCWGTPPYALYSTGDGTTNQRLVPTAVLMPSGVKKFIKLYEHTSNIRACALGDNYKTYCWGYNEIGEIGTGKASGVEKVPTLVNVPPEAGYFTDIRIGTYEYCGFGAKNQQLYCWGSAGSGEIGDGKFTPTTRTTPTAVKLPSGVNKFTEFYMGQWFVCALGDNKIPYCWGFGGWSQLGNGSGTNKAVPTPLTLPPGVTYVKKLVAGYKNGCIIGNDDQMYCWGYNLYGVLGDGTTTDRNVPTKVTLPPGVTGWKAFLGDKDYIRWAGSQATTSAISKAPEVWSSGWDSLRVALGNDDKYYIWGYNGDGIFGDGTLTGSHVPIPYVPDHIAQYPGNRWCGYDSTGKAYCWGKNIYNGWIGDGTLIDRKMPVPIAMPEGTSRVVSAIFYKAPGTRCAFME